MNRKREFTIPGKPQGKGRPRATVRRGFAQMYTPDNTRKYERNVQLAYMAAYPHDERMEGALKATIKATFAVPASTSKKRRAELLHDIWFTKKCDADNIAKIVLDPLNRLAYTDDSQVAQLIVTKEYGEKEQVHVTLEEIGYEQNGSVAIEGDKG